MYFLITLPKIRVSHLNSLFKISIQVIPNYSPSLYFIFIFELNLNLLTHGENFNWGLTPSFFPCFFFSLHHSQPLYIFETTLQFNFL